MTNIIKASPSDSGCWIDGHWGQYATARLVEIAAENGFEESDLVDIAQRHLASMGPSDSPDITDDEWEVLHSSSDEVEAWLNDNIAPAGHYFEWTDGEFFLRATAGEVMRQVGLRPLWWSIYRDAERDAYETGDSISMGDLVGPDEPSSVRLANGPADFYEIPVTLWGDYCGDICGRSNHRSLLRDHPDTFSDVYGGYSSHFLVIPADTEDENGTIVEELVPIFVKLRDEYPIYDEEDESALETELAEEAWDAYLRYDVMSDLDKAGIDTDTIDEVWLREKFYELTYAADNFPYAESADSIVFPYANDTVSEIAKILAIGHPTAKRSELLGLPTNAEEIAARENAAGRHLEVGYVDAGFICDACTREAVSEQLEGMEES